VEHGDRPGYVRLVGFSSHVWHAKGEDHIGQLLIFSDGAHEEFQPDLRGIDRVAIAIKERATLSLGGELNFEFTIVNRVDADMGISIERQAVLVCLIRGW
jgi:hypothetical protein